MFDYEGGGRPPFYTWSTASGLRKSILEGIRERDPGDIPHFPTLSDWDKRDV
jgi:hypothetical protein